MWTISTIADDLEKAKSIVANNKMNEYNDDIEFIKDLIKSLNNQLDYEDVNIYQIQSYFNDNKDNNALIKQFFYLTRGINYKNSGHIYSKIRMPKNENDVLSITHDFYKTLPKNIYNTFLKLYKNRGNNLNFLKNSIFDENYEGETYFIPIVNNVYMNIYTENNSHLPIVAIHEYAHGIQHLLNNNYTNYEYLYNDLDSYFFELLAYDFLPTVFSNISSLDLHYDFYDLREFNYDNFKLAAKYFRILNKNSKMKINNKYIVDYDDLLGDLSSYISAIELYMIYKEDPEKAFHIYDQILSCYNDNDKILELLNINSRAEDYVKLLKPNNF